MASSPIRLLLLDFDGTLADTRRANTLAYIAALREAGYRLSEQEYISRYFGMRCNEFLTQIGIADPTEREAIRQRKIALYPTFFDCVRLNEPLWAFCSQFRQQQGRVWIVSTGSRANIDHVMEYLGIGSASTNGPKAIQPDQDTDNPIIGNSPHHVQRQKKVKIPQEPRLTTQNRIDHTGGSWRGEVDGILSGADVLNPKPSPECFLKVMHYEGCAPHEALIFEDSAIGIEAARRSGAPYVVVKM